MSVAYNMGRTDSGLGQCPWEEHAIVDQIENRDLVLSTLGPPRHEVEDITELPVAPASKGMPTEAPNNVRRASWNGQVQLAGRGGSCGTSIRERRRKPSTSMADSRRSSVQTAPTLHSAARPPGPRRIKSGPAGPLSDCEVEKALELHERSCRLFQSFSSATPVERSRKSPRPSSVASYRGSSVPAAQSPRLPALREPELSIAATEREPVTETLPTTVIHWTSPSTRRQEYAAIDRSHKGFRGLVKRLIPRWLCKTSYQNFYSEKDGSDAGSVRRYRLDVPDTDGPGPLETPESNASKRLG